MLQEQKHQIDMLTRELQRSNDQIKFLA